MVATNNWEVNGDKGGGVHSTRLGLWRWEEDLELSHGQSMLDPADSAKTFGRKAAAKSPTCTPERKKR